MVRMLKLYCLDDGESPSHAFFVKIPSTDEVDDLRKLIMAEKSPEFDDIAADKLTLWSVSIANDDDYDEIPILLDNLTDQDKKLKPTTKLSKVFDVDLPEETIHIIVRRPAPEFTVTVKGVRYRNNATLEWMAASTATLQWTTDTATATLDEHRNE
ncbi:hypothetical protein BGZ52_003918, partial [Haplosporangium bisporale]